MKRMHIRYGLVTRCGLDPERLNLRVTEDMDLVSCRTCVACTIEDERAESDYEIANGDVNRARQRDRLR